MFLIKVERIKFSNFVRIYCKEKSLSSPSPLLCYCRVFLWAHNLRDVARFFFEILARHVGQHLPYLL